MLSGKILTVSEPETKIAEYANRVDLEGVAHCCPLVFELSRYSLDLTFFENLQTKILSSAFLYLK